jgi:hypothetical protein
VPVLEDTRRRDGGSREGGRGLEAEGRRKGEEKKEGKKKKEKREKKKMK